MGLKRLRDFVAATTGIVAQGGTEAAVMDAVRQELAGLIAEDDWLPDRFAEPDPARYRQNLLYGDPLDRFSLVSFVWAPGQKTPVHDHLMWGLVGMLRGAETNTDWRRAPDGRLDACGQTVLRPGDIAAVSPTLGDTHEVANALTDRASISIHCYGGNIGTVRRHVFVPATGEAKEFVSGYSNDLVPNLWA